MGRSLAISHPPVAREGSILVPPSWGARLAMLASMVGRGLKDWPEPDFVS